MLKNSLPHLQILKTRKLFSMKQNTPRNTGTNVRQTQHSPAKPRQFQQGNAVRTPMLSLALHRTLLHRNWLCRRCQRKHHMRCPERLEDQAPRTLNLVHDVYLRRIGKLPVTRQTQRRFHASLVRTQGNHARNVRSQWGSVRRQTLAPRNSTQYLRRGFLLKSRQSLKLWMKHQFQ